MGGEGADIGFETGFALPGSTLGEPLDPGRTYDVLVLGAGPAGLSAAIYLLRKGLDTGIVTSNIGGQVTWTASIENYLGYRLVEGVQLVEKFNEQLKSFPLGINRDDEVTVLSGADGAFEVRTRRGTYRARALILATGKRPRMLNVPGEKKLMGRGVAYCAICDAPLYKGKTTAVAGGGNAGLEAAIDLSRVSPKVYVIERMDRLTGDSVLVEEVKSLENVEIMVGTEVLEVIGDENVRAISVRDGSGGAAKEVAVEGVFVEIGLVPNSGPFRGFVPLNERGEVEIDCSCRTGVPGVFAAGDVTAVPFKQIVIAAGDGAKAALSCHDHLLRKGKGAQGDPAHDPVQ
jgi:alkyl hydroperoxide reductase subunit F